VYLFLLLLDAGGHDAQHLIRQSVLLCVLPLTVLMALLVWWQERAAKRKTP
jgi:hypothetical protein